VPVDGSSGNFEWQGFITFDELPSFYNPPRGVIVTANQNPFPPEYTYTVNGNFASQYRSNQIRNLLTARNGWRAEDMLAVQKDVYSGFLKYVAEAIVAAYDKNKAQHVAIENAVALLRGWNGQVEKGDAAPMVATLAYQQLRRMVAEKASPALGARYEYQMAPAVVEKLLRTRPAGWFSDWDEAILRSCAEGLEEGRRTQGHDAGHWNYGKYAQLLLANPVGRHLPLVAGLFDIGPVAMSGGATTVKQLNRDLGPSMRMDADLADWDHSLLEGTTGQSGQVLSSHYKDQWERYYSAQSFPMQFGKVTAKDILTLVP